MKSITTKSDSSQPVADTAVYLFDDWFDPIEARTRCSGGARSPATAWKTSSSSSSSGWPNAAFRTTSQVRHVPMSPTPAPSRRRLVRARSISVIGASSASSSAMMSASDGVRSRGCLCRPSRWKARPSRSVSRPYSSRLITVPGRGFALHALAGDADRRRPTGELALALAQNVVATQIANDLAQHVAESTPPRAAAVGLNE